MRLHENKKLFRQAIQATSDKLGILPIYVEKDYWVTYALHAVFSHEIGKDTVFKGGTALSKCHKLISRFSEDIDLVVLRKDEESNNQLTNKIKKISEVVGSVLPEIQVQGLTRKMGMNRKTAHSYQKDFEGSYGQVRDAIVVEATWLGNFEPYSTQKIMSFAGEMMLTTGQEKIAEENGLLPFEIQVLDPTRTFCEKIMSLVRFSYSEKPVEELQKKIRHTYDLHQLLKNDDLSQFFISTSFDAMLLKVANDDVLSYKNNNGWLTHHPCKSTLFQSTEEVWKELAPVFNSDFKKLVYGDFPKDSDVLITLNTIRKRLDNINWTITIAE